MKSIVCIVLLSGTLLACKKSSVVVEEEIGCYECKSPTPPRNWEQVGCFTENEWNDLDLKDASGNPVDKSTCRKR